MSSSYCYIKPRSSYNNKLLLLLTTPVTFVISPPGFSSFGSIKTLSNTFGGIKCNWKFVR